MGAAIRFLIIGFARTIGIIGVTMTFRYGLVFTGGEDRMLMAALFALCDAIKCLLPGYCIYRLSTGAKEGVRELRVAYYFLAAMTLGSHAGLVVTLKAHDQALASAAGNQTEGTADRVARLRREIAPLEAMTLRPMSVILTDIEVAENKAIFTEAARSNRCTNATADSSRDHCDAWRKLKGERDSRVELTRLSAELELAKVALAAQHNQKAAVVVTPIIEELATATGSSNRSVMLIFAFAMAIMIELCSSQILKAAVATGHKPRVGETPTLPAEAPETAIPQPLMPAIAADTLQDDGGMDAEAASDKPKADAQDWVGMRLLGHRSASVSYPAAYDAHAAEAEASGMTPASKNAFSRALKFHGYEAKCIGGDRELMILGAVLKERREVGPLRVVK